MLISPMLFIFRGPRLLVSHRGGAPMLSPLPSPPLPSPPFHERRRLLFESSAVADQARKAARMPRLFVSYLFYPDFAAVLSFLIL
jgi:hypothetical protein